MFILQITQASLLTFIFLLKTWCRTTEELYPLYSKQSISNISCLLLSEDSRDFWYFLSLCREHSKKQNKQYKEKEIIYRQHILWVSLCVLSLMFVFQIVELIGNGLFSYLHVVQGQGYSQC